MNLFETNECAKFFLELYPNATVAQVEAVRGAIGLYEVEDFKKEARGVLIDKPFVNDAISALIERLKYGKAHTASARVKTWVDEENERVKRECERIQEQYAADDELLEPIPPATAEELGPIAATMAQVIGEQEEPIRSMWKRKGLRSRAVRCAVAEMLRQCEDGTAGVSVPGV